MKSPKQRHDGDGSVFKVWSNDRTTYKWRAQRTYWERDSQGNMRRRYLSGTASTGKEAIKRLEVKVAKKFGDRLTDQELKQLTPTVSEYVERYLLSRGSKLAAESARKYRRDFEIHILPDLGKVRLDELTTPMLDNFFYIIKKDMLPSAKYHVYTNFMALLNHAIKHEVIEKNPLKLVTRPEKRTEISREDQKWINARASITAGFLKWVENHETYNEHYTRFLFMFMGLRRAELLGLEWSAFNQLNRKGKASMVIQQQLKQYEKSDPREGWYLQPLTKSRRDRVVYLPEIFRLALLAEKKKHQEARKSLPDELKDLVFITPEGSHYTYKKHYGLWNVILKEYVQLDMRKFKPQHLFRPHYARHIAASVMLNKGIGIEAIQDILGHSDAAMSLHYAHLRRETQKNAAEALTGITK